MWKFVGKKADTSSVSIVGDIHTPEEADKRPVDAALREGDEQKRYLALVSILTSADISCKAMIRQVRCLYKTWTTIKETFKFMIEALIEANLSYLQAIVLK